jgi:hypothetical protein
MKWYLWAMLQNFLRLEVTTFWNRLERLSLASLSSLVLCLGVRPGAYPRVEHLKCASLGSGLTHKNYTILERLARDKLSILLWEVVTYVSKKFCNIGLWSLSKEAESFIFLTLKSTNVSCFLSIRFQSNIAQNFGIFYFSDILEFQIYVWCCFYRCAFTLNLCWSKTVLNFPRLILASRHSSYWHSA